MKSIHCYDYNATCILLYSIRDLQDMMVFQELLDHVDQEVH